MFIDEIYNVRWSSNGEKLVTASGDGSVTLLDHNTGKVIDTFRTNDGGRISYRSI